MRGVLAARKGKQPENEHEVLSKCALHGHNVNNNELI